MQVKRTMVVQHTICWTLTTTKRRMDRILRSTTKTVVWEHYYVQRTSTIKVMVATIFLPVRSASEFKCQVMNDTIPSQTQVRKSCVLRTREDRLPLESCPVSIDYIVAFCIIYSQAQQKDCACVHFLLPERAKTNILQNFSLFII